MSTAAGLDATAARRLRDGFDLLTRESLACPARPPYVGLSRINANGLPFQWCVCIDGGAPSVRFLCETGLAGDTASSRMQLAIGRLIPLCDAIGTSYPPWIERFLLAPVIPSQSTWPAHWQSAIWYALGAQADVIGLKVYLNLDHGDAASRWHRVGWVLKGLGREQSLADWCAMSPRVSHQSWLTGLAVDVRPDGSAGRVKAYFQSGTVALSWLDRWYVALGAHAALRDVRHMVDLLGPEKTEGRLPSKAFFVSVEFSADGESSLKTDLPVCRWHKRDAAVSARVRHLLGDLALDEAPYLRALQAMGCGTFDEVDGNDTVHQLVGLGYEPDGARHVNIYCAPPVPPVAPDTVG